MRMLPPPVSASAAAPGTVHAGRKMDIEMKSEILNFLSRRCLASNRNLFN